LELDDGLARLIECAIEKVKALAKERVDGEDGKTGDGGGRIVLVLVLLEQGRRHHAENDDESDESDDELDSKTSREKRLCGGPETDCVRHMRGL
jgi:hypothetical protein